MLETVVDAILITNPSSFSSMFTIVSMSISCAAYHPSTLPPFFDALLLLQSEVRFQLSMWLSLKCNTSHWKDCQSNSILSVGA